MNTNNSPAEPAPGVRDDTKHHFCMLYHKFLDAWMPILTPAEVLVFLSVQRTANFGSHSTDGYWSVEICRKLTGLNRKTIREAMSTCRQLGLIATVRRPGHTSFYVINQDLMPSPEIIRGGRKGANVWRKGRGTTWSNGSYTNPENGSTSTWVAPPPGSIPTVVRVSSQTNLSGNGPTNKSPKVLETELKTDDDDDDRRYFPKLLIDGFAELGLTLDVGLADRFVKDLWATKPGIEVGEILMIARDRLPGILRNKFVKSHLPYLLKSIVECCIGPTFDNFRQRWQNQKAEEERKTADMNKIAAERG